MEIFDSLLSYGAQFLGYALAGIVIYLVTKYVVPFLTSKMGKDNYDLMVEIIKQLMSTAERQILGDKAGPKRKEWVLEQIQKVMDEKSWDFDIKYISDLIDGMTNFLEAEGVINTQNFEPEIKVLEYKDNQGEDIVQ